MQLWKNRSFGRAIEAALWTGVLGFAAWRIGPQAAAAIGAGGRREAAPEIAVTTLAGEPVSSADLRGRVVVVNFWASWCPPCRLETPGFERTWRARRDDGLVVLGLSTDTREEDARRFLAARGVTYPVAMAGRRETDSFGGIRGLPATFLIDRQGRVRYRVTGFFAEPALRLAVDRLLAEPVPTAAAEGGRPWR